MRSVWACVVLAGCFQPQVEPCVLACASDGDCPSSLRCDPVAGRCADAEATTACRVSAARSLSCEFDTTCLVAAGEVYCWGDNQRGEIGRNPEELLYTATPLPIGIDAPRRVATSQKGSCALTAKGVIHCWGPLAFYAGAAEQDDWQPAEIATVDADSWLAANYEMACAGTEDGTLCWGRNLCGSFGIGTEGTATGVVGVGRNASGVAIGATFACFLDGDGGIGCAGKNDRGQLGFDDACAPSSLANCTSDCEHHQVQPVVALEDAHVVGAAAGLRHACALVDGAEPWCWGDADLFGGLEGEAAPPAPVQPPAGCRFVDLDLGEEASCGRCEDGRVFCWGSDEFGQLGNGGRPPSVEPDAVVGIDGAREICVGQRHACALVAGDDVHCWGDNSEGQLGVESPGQATEPMRVDRVW